jgi:hypothetical protein
VLIKDFTFISWIIKSGMAKYYCLSSGYVCDPGKDDLREIIDPVLSALTGLIHGNSHAVLQTEIT